MNNWMLCQWSIVIGKVWQCETCGATAKILRGQNKPTCTYGGQSNG